mmetsp:Transcript_10687/g.32148  ORF Transcript_10687/g.32148 Transcript_10687/m.32148 type:complete len:234 (+) Transcript_10687:569-1270(+)
MGSFFLLKRLSSATSIPATQRGSLAQTTQLPSCETLTFQLGHSFSSGAGAARNGFLPLVRLTVRPLKLVWPSTDALAWRMSRRDIMARFLSSQNLYFRTCALSSSSCIKLRRNWNSAPSAPPAGSHSSMLTAHLCLQPDPGPTTVRAGSGVAQTPARGGFLRTTNSLPLTLVLIQPSAGPVPIKSLYCRRSPSSASCSMSAPVQRRSGAAGEARSWPVRTSMPPLSTPPMTAH